MNIYGHEYGMLYTVGAQQELAALCPDGDLTRLKEVTKGKISEVTPEAAKIPMILSDWHERAKSLEAAAEGGSYTPAPLSWDVIQLLSVQEFWTLMGEAFTCMARDMGRTVEADGVSTQKKTEAAAVS